MRFNISIAVTLFRAELKMVLRDRRVLVSSIIMPLLVTPLMFLGANWSIKHRQHGLSEMVYHYAVTGPKADFARAVVGAALELRNLAGTTNAPSTVPGSRIRRSRKTATAGTLKFQEMNCTNNSSALARGDLQFFIEGLAGSDLGTKSSESAARQGQSENEGEAAASGVPAVRLVYRADRDDSALAVAEVQDALEQFRRVHRSRLLQGRGFAVSAEQLATVTEKDLASKRQIAGLTLGRSLTVLLLIFILTSGAVVATDSIAGEKERGTLETILTTAVNRVEILAAKSLVILAIALLITLIQTGNLLVYAGFKLIPVPPNLSAAVSVPVGALLVFLFFPVAALAASVLLLISGYARSYREAQMYFMPALLIGLLPGLAPFLPGVPLRSILVLVPVANIALAVKEILLGAFDWPMIGLSWLITAGTAVWSLRAGVRFLSAERLVIGGEKDAAEFAGGLALFERHVVRWFAVLWAALLITGNYIEKVDLRLQVLINLIGLFFGACCLVLWRYGLNARQVFALRLPRPWVWLGVLFAVPGGVLTSLGLFRLSNLVLPVSTQLTEKFNQNVMPEGVPGWQLLFFLTLLPGLFEELAFRGLLLHGLHRRLRPGVLVLVVGLAFGIFHVALFRFVPTAALGVMFASVTLLTGSIYPAMMWHTLNNAVGILAYRWQIPENDLPAGCYLAGVGILAMAFWIFYRNRSPYPGLRRPLSERPFSETTG